MRPTLIIYRPGSFWNAERDTVLRRMWLADQHSAEEIARTIGASSRNAVIGRAHRIGLPGKSGKGRGQVKGKSLGVHPGAAVARILNGRGKPFQLRDKSIIRHAPKIEALPLPAPAAEDKARVSFVDLDNHHCRWPVGETANILPDTPIFCGLKRMPGSSYCPGHWARSIGAPIKPRPPTVPAEAPVVQTELEAA